MAKENRDVKIASKPNKLKIILPIIIVTLAIVLAAGILLGVLLPPRIAAKKYFAAIASSPYTKQVQTTVVMEGERLVYEKQESLTIDGEVMYHKIVEKQLSSDYDTDYTVTTTEYYYTSSRVYYYENGVLKVKEFKVSNKFNSYNLEYGFFKSIKLDKSIKTTGTLQGNLKQNSVAKVDDSLSSLSNINISIVVDKSYNIQNFKITGVTSESREVTIENVYTYNNEQIYLPSV